MDDNEMNDEPTESDGIDGPHGKWMGVPYDWRRPMAARFKARWWNADDHRIFTPRAFGWGYDVNLHRVLHPGAHRD